MFDLLLTGGRIVDGTGGPERGGDVGVVDGRIVAVEPLAGASARRTVDVTGLVLCPGFVDVHAHSDLTLLSGAGAQSKVRQGVTTEVVGNCGLGPAPLPDGVDRGRLRAAINHLDLDPSVCWTWRDFDAYLDTLAAARTSLHVAALVGHLPLRAAAVGHADRPATPAELDRMRGLLAEALAAGAVGLSTGLVYAPARYADEHELVDLGRVVAESDGVFAWHLRDYADDLLDSVAQALRVGERAGCRTQISHLVSVGRRNRGAAARALELVDAAAGRGLDVGVDIYPYLAGNTSLYQLIPGWAQEGGGPAMLGRLRDSGVRDRIRAELAGHPLGWDEIVISRIPVGGPEGVVGRSVAGLAEQAGRPGADVVMDLLVEYDNDVGMVAFGRDHDDLVAVLTHPLAVVGSDGYALDPEGPTGIGMPHPRSYGTYPRILAEYVRTGILDLADAVAKCTSRPASRIGIDDRGVIARGMVADLVAFDADSVRDRATFDEPQRYPNGIRLVVVEGSVVVDEGRHTGARPGAVLRRRNDRKVESCRVP
ncbi:N-acyl-D-amino-acid deacylase family protein [Plantactinospora sp. WMMB334]|uniref:N-acyl-D-amino-acid deacylase family protein n=1 Tax=Plantactinospora sp. WMMB334 TaxID=3404119 RepID=UPI003B93AFCD